MIPRSRGGEAQLNLFAGKIIGIAEIVKIFSSRFHELSAETRQLRRERRRCRVSIVFRIGCIEKHQSWIGLVQLFHLRGQTLGSGQLVLNVQKS